ETDGSLILIVGRSGFSDEAVTRWYNLLCRALASASYAWRLLSSGAKEREPMPKLRATLWSALSAALGLLSILPSFHVFPRSGLGWAQLVATENPGLAMGSGGIGILR